VFHAHKSGHNPCSSAVIKQTRPSTSQWPGTIGGDFQEPPASPRGAFPFSLLGLASFVGPAAHRQKEGCCASRHHFAGVTRGAPSKSEPSISLPNSLFVPDYFPSQMCGPSTQHLRPSIGASPYGVRTVSAVAPVQILVSLT
jgi:hypothetical protein